MKTPNVRQGLIRYLRSSVTEFGRNETGSILTTALGVVALVGVLSFSAYNLLSGPVRTAANVTASNKAVNDLIIAARLLMRSATQADTDFPPEAPEWVTGTGPTGGGQLPNLGMDVLDPWGTRYGYCSWDHTEFAETPAATGNRRVGVADPAGEFVILTVSAGPDRAFDGGTVCSDGATFTTGGDDIYQAYTYNEATALSEFWYEAAADEITSTKKDVTIPQDLDVTNDAQISGTANVTGAFTAGSTGTFTGLLTANNGLSVSNGTVTDTINVGTGALVADSTDITTSAAHDLNGTFDVDGTGDFDGINIGQNTPANGAFLNLDINGTHDLDGTFDIDGSGNMDGIVIGANSAVNGTFTNLTASSSLTINGGTHDLNGTFDIDGTGNFDGINIGQNTPAAGDFTTLTADSSDGNTVTNFSADIIDGVNVTATGASNGDALIYNNGTSTWEPNNLNGDVDGSLVSNTVDAIEGIDVNPAGPADGEALTYMGGTIVFVKPNADSLDGVDSSQFLRSDVSDTYTNGTLDFDPGTILDVNGQLNVAATSTTDLTYVLGFNSTTDRVYQADGTELIDFINSNDGDGSGLDADTLDGLNSTEFLRSNAPDTYNGGQLTIDTNTNSSSVFLDLGSDGGRIHMIDRGSNRSDFALTVYDNPDDAIMLRNYDQGAGTTVEMAKFGRSLITHYVDTLISGADLVAETTNGRVRTETDLLGAPVLSIQKFDGGGDNYITMGVGTSGASIVTDAPDGFRIKVGADHGTSNSEVDLNQATDDLFQALNDGNIFAGLRAGDATTSAGWENVFIGYEAGDNNIGGDRNVIIGPNTDNLTSSTNNYLNIANTIYGDLGTNTVGMNDDGDITIGGDLTVTGTIISASGGSDADTLDGLDSLQFLRADVDDAFTGGTLTVGTVLDMDTTGIVRNSLSYDLSNSEQATHGTEQGRFYYDANYFSDFAAITGGDGGGMAVYSEDGWGALLDTNNMQWTTGTFDGLRVPARNGAPTIGGTSLNNAWILVGVDGTGIGIDPNEIIVEGADMNFGSGSSHPIRFRTNDSVNARLSAAGNLYVGGDVDASHRLEVNAIAGGGIDVIASDSEEILTSRNASASNADQFYLQHNLGNVEVGNNRGDINLTAGDLNITDALDVTGQSTFRSNVNLQTNIFMNNNNISDANQVSINDPGEGFIFSGNTTGNKLFRVIDDATDNLVELNANSATNHIFQLNNIGSGDWTMEINGYRVLTTNDEGSIDADTLDGLDSLQFLRADANDTYGDGGARTLVIGSDDTLDVQGVISDSTGNLTLDDNVDINGNLDLVGGTMSGDDLTDGTVDSSEIQNNTLTAADLAPDSVEASELADNSVASANIIANTIVAADIAADAVGASELADNSVASANVINDSLTGTDIDEATLNCVAITGDAGLCDGLDDVDGGDAGSIGGLTADQFLRADASDTYGDGGARTLTIGTGSDDAIVIASGTTVNFNNLLDAGDLGVGSVGTSEVADNTLTASDLAADSVGASELADNSVASANVINNTLTADDLAADSVEASELANNSVASANVINNSLTGTDIDESTLVIPGDTIVDGSIDGTEVDEASLNCSLITGGAGLCDGTDADTNAVSLCADNEFLDGDGTCHNIATCTDDSSKLEWSGSAWSCSTTINADQLNSLSSSDFFRTTASNSADLRFSSGNGRGMRFWDSDNYKIWMSSATDGTWGGRLDGSSDYNMYFRMSGGTNRGFVFQSSTTEVAQIDASGNLYLAGELSGDSITDGSIDGTEVDEASLNCALITGSAALCDGNDADTNTNAVTLCGNNEFLDGDGTCHNIGTCVNNDQKLEWTGSTWACSSTIDATLLGGQTAGAYLRANANDTYGDGGARTLTIGSDDVLDVTGSISDSSGYLTLNDTVDVSALRVTNGNYIGSTGESLRFHGSFRAEDSSYEWIGYYSGSTRQAIMLYDAAWSGCRNDANDFCLKAENSNDLTLYADTNLYLMGDTVFANGNRVLTTADEGSGNGIDADTLDGITSSGFVSASGDDMTGLLEIDLPGTNYEHITLEVAGEPSDQARIQIRDGGSSRGYFGHAAGGMVIRNDTEATTFVVSDELYFNGDEVYHQGNESSITAGNSNNLGGQPAANYLRSNQTDNFTAGNLTFNVFTSLTMAAGSDLLMNGDFTASSGAVIDLNTNNFTLQNASSSGTISASVLSASSRVQAPTVRYTSDRTKKDNIVHLDNSLDSILKLDGYNYTWKDGTEEYENDQSMQIGLIAQEVKKVFPEVVSGEEGNMGVNYAGLIAPIIEAIKEIWGYISELTENITMLFERDTAQQAEIDALKARIEALEARLAVQQ